MGSSDSEQPPSAPSSASANLAPGIPDSLSERALVAGGTQVARMSEDFGWRIGRLEDPFGHNWEIGRQLGGPD